MRILCVDDSATLRKIVSMSLVPAGHTVVEAANGQEGLEKLRAEAFDCILLDVNMPVMGGLDFLRARSGDPAKAGIPVIVLTTEQDKREEALAAGATQFLAKPFQKQDLLQALQQIPGA